MIGKVLFVLTQQVLQVITDFFTKQSRYFPIKTINGLFRIVFHQVLQF